MTNREATWARIGADVRNATTLDEVMQIANLDYEVHAEPIQTASGIIIPQKCATVKNDGTPIGVVSDSYEILQNKDAFDFVSDIPNMKFERAGETKSGMIYLIGKLPDTTVLGDTFTPHVIFQTSHNGRYNLRATICPLRIVCQNQFAYSFKQMRNTIEIRHSAKMPVKVAQARALMRDTATYMQGFSDTAEELAMLKLRNGDSIYAIIDAFFDSTKEITERQKKAIEAQRSAFITAYREDDNANFTGTAWGVVNAFSDFTSHKEPGKKMKDTTTQLERQFMAVTFDTNLVKLMQCIRANVAA